MDSYTNDTPLRVAELEWAEKTFFGFDDSTARSRYDFYVPAVWTFGNGGIRYHDRCEFHERIDRVLRERSEIPLTDPNKPSVVLWNGAPLPPEEKE